MNGAHLHLILNHTPVLGSGFALALLVYAMARNSDELKKTALWAFVVVGLLTVPAYLTGEPAEHVVRQVAPDRRELIHEHSDAASAAFTASSVLGVFAIFALVKSSTGRPMRKWEILAALVLALLTTAIMARAAYLGGLIMHTEIG